MDRYKVDWGWNDATKESFVAVKVANTTAPVLHPPYFECEFAITTDTSDVVIEAILEQDFGSGLQPIALASCTLAPQKCAIQRMKVRCWAFFGLVQWTHYYQGSYHIVIRTDHTSLRHLPNYMSVNCRIWHWFAILKQCNVEIRHILG